ncbi:WavE lipopolysaccharide synthesis [Candidatus Nanopelagicaceae bacterium]
MKLELNPIVEKYVYLSLRLASKMIVNLPTRYHRKIAEYSAFFIDQVARQSGYFTTLNFKLLSPEKWFGNSDSSEIGIVIQGPVENSAQLENVYESVALYNKIFPQSLIVISTWENSMRVNHNSGLNFIGVVQPDPGKSWPTNLVRQVSSTRLALMELKLRGIKYAVKTRSDQRMCAPEILSILRARINESGCESKLFVSSYGTGKYRPYSFTDQWQFGLTDRLLKFWDTENLDGISKTPPPLDEEWKKIRYNSAAIHESRLSTGYLNSIGFKVTWSWENHLSSLRRHFGIVDSEEIGLLLLNRKRSVNDHVLPGMTFEQSQTEQHLTRDTVLSYCDDNRFSPKNSVILRALKVPQNDNLELMNYWRGYDGLHST